jgi:hypothetical protein
MDVQDGNSTRSYSDQFDEVLCHLETIGARMSTSEYDRVSELLFELLLARRRNKSEGKQSAPTLLVVAARGAESTSQAGDAPRQAGGLRIVGGAL